MRFTGLAVVAVAASMCVLTGGCAHPSAGNVTSDTLPGTVYTKYNVHYRTVGADTAEAHYTGWFAVCTEMLPPNTAVEVQASNRPGAAFALVVPNGPTIHYLLESRHMGMNAKEFLLQVTSAEPVALGRLSALDRQGVSQGVALKGMSKEGVLTALGYPSRHRTPSLENNTWYYWRNRFAFFAVEFGSDGMVVHSQQ